MSDEHAGALLLHVARINVDRSTRYMDEREPVEGTIFEGVDAAYLSGALYRHGVREYGRCIGKVHVDTASRGTIHTGYVFLKRERYEDSNDTYLCETWLSVERVIAPAQPTTIIDDVIAPAQPTTVESVAL